MKKLKKTSKRIDPLDITDDDLVKLVQLRDELVDIAAKKKNLHMITMEEGKRPLCDYKDCKNKCYMEVYPSKPSSGWSYLCRKHYAQEQKKHKGKLAAAKAMW
jgi:hypothetical protein